MKLFILIAFTLIMIFSWVLPFLIVHISHNNTGYWGFGITFLVTGTYIEWVDDKWDEIDKY